MLPRITNDSDIELISPSLAPGTMEKTEYSMQAIFADILKIQSRVKLHDKPVWRSSYAMDCRSILLGCKSQSRLHFFSVSKSLIAMSGCDDHAS